ncbi:Uncharacterized protein QTN25_010086 [Entamoeba marina]
MFALFALVFIASADTITVPLTKDNDGNYISFYIVETGECYTAMFSPESSIKYEKSDDGYVKYSYLSIDCSSTAVGPNNVEDYKKNELDVSFASFYDDESCSHSTSDEYNIAKSYFTTECIVQDSYSSKYKTDDGKIVTTVYSGSDCSGTSSTVEQKCDVCSDEIYMYCGSTINTIMAISLAIFLILF